MTLMSLNLAFNLFARYVELPNPPTRMMVLDTLALYLSEGTRSDSQLEDILLSLLSAVDQRSDPGFLRYSDRRFSASGDCPFVNERMQSLDRLSDTCLSM